MKVIPLLFSLLLILCSVVASIDYPSVTITDDDATMGSLTTVWYAESMTADRTFTLPDISNLLLDGRYYIVYNLGSNSYSIYLTAASGDTIVNSGSSMQITPGQGVHVIADKGRDAWVPVGNIA